MPFFDTAYHDLFAPLHSEAETRAEVGAVRELLGLALGDRVLDLGCGWGRHAVLLAGAGHEVVGCDVSPPLLRLAARRAAALGAGLPLAAADMLALPFADRGFDVVLNLSSSLGLFLDDDAAVAALREARRVLRPGGTLLLDDINGDDAIRHFAVRDAWTLPDGTRVRVRRRLDGRVSHEVLRWRASNGRAGIKRHSLKLRGAARHEALLTAAGLTVRAAHGSWAGAPPTADAERVILVAQR